MKIAWFFLLALVLGLVAATGLRYGIDRTLEARGSRVQLSQAAANLLGGEAGFGPLKWRGRTISSAVFVAQSPERDFQIRAARVEIPSSFGQLIRRQWKIDNLHADYLRVAMGAPSDDADMPELVAPAPNESPTNGAPLRISAPRADIFWNGGDVRDGAAEVARVPAQTTLNIHGGVLHCANFSGARVQELQLVYNKPALRIERATLAFGETGLINSRGELQPALDVDLAFSRCPISALLGSAVRGEFEAHGHAHKMPNESLRASGTINAANAIVQNIGALQRAAQLAGRADLAELKIDNVRGDCDFDGETVTVKNFVLEAKPLLALRGEFSVRGERIDGEFEFGVAPDLTDKFPGARDDVFKSNRDGYLWAPVSVSGSVANLRDNLRPRLLRAAEAHHADEKTIEAIGEL